jgi:tetratricopeptide (TPR) repeat protein
VQYIGNVDRSVEILEQALLLDPESLDLVFDLCDAYRIVGRDEDALVLLRAAKQRLPESSVVRIKLASCLNGEARIAESAEAVRLQPDSAVAHFRLGLAYAFVNRFEEADLHFAKAIELDPCMAIYYNSRGINLQMLCKPKEAEAEYRKALTIDPDFVLSLIGLGAVLTNTGKYEEADRVLRRAIAVDPAHPDGYYNLGLNLQKQNRMGEAAQMLRKACELDATNVDYPWALAYVLGSTGKFEEALPAWEAALRASPDHPSLLAALGWSQIENHRWEGAVSSLRRSIAKDSQKEYTLSSLGNLAFALIHLGRLDEAEEALKEAFRLKPNDPDTSSNWALLLAHRGTDLDQALTLAKQRAEPGSHAQWFYILGFVHLKREEFDQAIEALKTSADGFGKCYLAADALVLLGRAYEGKKDSAAALHAYRRALGIEPGNAPAARAIKRLGA